MSREILEESVKALIEINNNIYTKICGINSDAITDDLWKLCEFYNTQIFVVERWLDELYPERLEAKERVRPKRLVFQTIPNGNGSSSLEEYDDYADKEVSSE